MENNNITKTIKESLEEFDKKFPELYSSNDGREGYDCEVSFDLKSHLLQSQIKVIEKTLELIESEQGKYGSQSGSFGYQGIVMGIQSVQTAEDQRRDKVISSLNETLEFLKKSL